MNHVRHARARRCVMAAIACFLLSLILPAVDMNVMSGPAILFGWHAWLYGAIGGVAALRNFGANALASWMWLPFLGAMLNLNFLAAGIWCRRARLPAAMPLFLVGLSSLGVLFSCL